MMPTVSDHAVQRYQERVAPLASRDVEAVIRAAVHRAGWHLGEWHIVMPGATFVMAGPHVITVTTRPPRVRNRHGRPSRARNAFREAAE